MREGDALQHWVTGALEEYRFHRAAYLEGLASAHRTLAFGVTAVGVLIAGGFSVWDSSNALPATLLFLVALPVICALVVLQWGGQMLFMVERHRYLLALEAALRKAHPTEPETLFTWEDAWAEYFAPRGGRWTPDHRWLANATVPLFGLVAAGGLGLGAYKGWDDAGAVVVIAAIVEFVALATPAVWLFVALDRALPAEPRDPDQVVRHAEKRKRAREDSSL